MKAGTFFSLNTHLGPPRKYFPGPLLLSMKLESLLSLTGLTLISMPASMFPLGFSLQGLRYTLLALHWKQLTQSLWIFYFLLMTFLEVSFQLSTTSDQQHIHLPSLINCLQLCHHICTYLASQVYRILCIHILLLLHRFHRSCSSKQEYPASQQHKHQPFLTLYDYTCTES